MSDMVPEQEKEQPVTVVSLTARGDDGVRRLTKDVFRATACPAHPLSQEAKDALGAFVLTGQSSRCLVEQRVDPDTHETTALLEPTTGVVGVPCSLVLSTGLPGFELVREYTEGDLLKASNLMLPQTKDALTVQLFCLRAGTECPEELDVVVCDGNNAAVVFIKPSTVTVVGSNGSGQNEDDRTWVCSRAIGGVAGLSGASSLLWTPFGQCAKLMRKLPEPVEYKMPTTTDDVRLQEGPLDHLYNSDVLDALDLVIKSRYDLNLVSLAIDARNGLAANVAFDISPVSTALQQVWIVIGTVLDRIDVAPEETEIYLNAKKLMQRLYGFRDDDFKWEQEE